MRVVSFLPVISIVNNFQYEFPPSSLTLRIYDRDFTCWWAISFCINSRKLASVVRTAAASGVDSLHGSRGIVRYWDAFAFQINTVRGSKWSIMTHFILGRARALRISCFGVNRGNAFGHQSEPRGVPRAEFCSQKDQPCFVPCSKFDFYSFAETKPRGRAFLRARNTCKQRATEEVSFESKISWNSCCLKAET